MRTNRTKTLFVMLIIAGVLMSCTTVALAGKGNAAPSGPHYNLNIIGMDKIDKKADIGCGEGHRIFVPLTGKAKIMLTEGDDFRVLDCVATSGSPAEFQLPNPDPCNTGTTEYSVFLRLRGKPGGRVIMGTCATDPGADGILGTDDDVEVCSDLKIVAVREKGRGKNKFQNVSKELLYIYAWVCVDYNEITKVCDEYEYMRLPLFDPLLEDYFWSYNNNGVRIAQLRFYPEVSTKVPDPLKSIAPSCLEPGDSNTVTIEAYSGHPHYADFSSGVDNISFGDGIDVDQSSINMLSPTMLQVDIDVKNNADPGLRIVTVTLNDGTELIIPFNVGCS